MENVPTPHGSILHPTRASQVPYRATHQLCVILLDFQQQKHRLCLMFIYFLYFYYRLPMGPGVLLDVPLPQGCGGLWELGFRV